MRDVRCDGGRVKVGWSGGGKGVGGGSEAEYQLGWGILPAAA